MNATEHGLGRVYAPDPRDADYRIKDAVPRSALRSTAWKARHWQMGRGLTYRDQGPYPHCVRYGCAHLLQLAAVVRRDAFELTRDLYPWAQRNDEWPGENYAGTSVRAGLEYLRTQAGLITEYRWAATMDEVRAYLTLPAKDGGGPLIVGTDFREGMDIENPDGMEEWEATGRNLGGHCYNVTGYSPGNARRSARYRIGNSHAGNYRAWMREDVLEYLLFLCNGEAAAVRELPK